MFTGLVREVARLTALRPTASGLDLSVHAPGVAAEAQMGDSVAVNGVCLTVTAFADGVLSFHAGEETIARSTASIWRIGQAVNVEPALRAGDRLGGHFVQGHVDAVGQCLARQAHGETVRFDFSLPADLAPFLVEKGSIAVDGISLTVTSVTEGAFGVAVIPHTIAQTTLQYTQPGASVNLEADVLAKYVRRALGLGASGISESFLAEHGYL